MSGAVWLWDDEWSDSDSTAVGAWSSRSRYRAVHATGYNIKYLTTAWELEMRHFTGTFLLFPSPR